MGAECICLYASETGYNAFFSIHLRFIDLNASILGIAFYMRQRFKFFMGNNWAFRLRHKKDHKVCNTLQLIVKDAFKQDEGFLKKAIDPSVSVVSAESQGAFPAGHGNSFFSRVIQIHYWKLSST